MYIWIQSSSRALDADVLELSWLSCSRLERRILTMMQKSLVHKPTLFRWT